MLKWDALLRQGYLPEILPPVFSTGKFADFIVKRSKLEFVGRPGKKHLTRSVEYDATKRANQRRTFAMPHPESFHDISLFISRYWKAIDNHFAQSNYSCSHPTVGQSKDRAVGITSHRDLASLIYKKMSPYRYLVKSDISRFYPSIYTHTVPWSFHGKDNAKRDTSPESKTIYFNNLDTLLRRSQDGQSVGLPIGPDTSRIIAEIVAVAVDSAFSLRFPDRNVAVLRHVDDIWIGASSMDDAEKYLYTYRECLRIYGLDINELKTSISENSKALDPSWPLSLKLLIKNEFQALNNEDKTKCLSDIFRQANEERDDGIIKYAIRRFDKEQLWIDHWSLLEDFLVRCLTSFPHTIDYVARVVAWMNRRGFELQKSKWEQVLSIALERNSMLGYDSEVCWLLWLMNEIEVTVPSNVWSHILDRCGAFPIVLLAHLDAGTIFDLPERKRRVLDRIGQNPFASAHWLLAYEALVNGWIKKDEFLAFDLSDFMMELVNADVTFYDPLATPWPAGDIDHDDDADYAIEDMSGRYDDDADETD